MNSPIYIQNFNAICSMGTGLTEISKHLFLANAPDFGQVSTQYSQKPLFLSTVNAACALPDSTPMRFRSRNNGLLHRVFSGLKDAWQTATADVAPQRLGVILGSSNSGIEEGEKAIAHQQSNSALPDEYLYEQQEYGSPALYLADLLGIAGPAYTVSTACSSSAKAFISGARLIQSGVCDVVLVGGSDTLSRLTVNGFLSLEAVDGGRSKPFSAHRAGIHLGEACALFILSKQPNHIQLLGWGESSDAHHMSAPHPEGFGAESSMRQALTKAGLQAQEIDYINLHGTATAQNDSMEAKAVARVFPNQPWVSSTKSLTGHTLGAAGAIEATFCCLSLQHETVPVHAWDGAYDDKLPQLRFVDAYSQVKPRYILSNSFGFGGSNASLIFASTP